MIKRTYSITVEVWRDNADELKTITQLVQEHVDQLAAIIQISGGVREPQISVAMHGADIGRVILTNSFMGGEDV